LLKFGNYSGSLGLVLRHFIARTEPAMTDRINKAGQSIDHLTSASIRKAVGEKLTQSLPPDSSSLPSRIEELLTEMRRQEGLIPHPERRTAVRSGS
jgi:hypothetical protein